MLALTTSVPDSSFIPKCKHRISNVSISFLYVVILFIDFWLFSGKRVAELLWTYLYRRETKWNSVFSKLEENQKSQVELEPTKPNFTIFQHQSIDLRSTKMENRVVGVLGESLETWLGGVDKSHRWRARDRIQGASLPTMHSQSFVDQIHPRIYWFELKAIQLLDWGKRCESTSQPPRIEKIQDGHHLPLLIKLSSVRRSGQIHSVIVLPYATHQDKRECCERSGAGELLWFLLLPLS